MARQGGGSVRIGPISLFALIILLCISVMGMLALSTGHAALASAQRQADNVSDVYENESEAWKFISKVDGVLSDVRDGDGGLAAATEDIEELLRKDKDASIKDGKITAKFSTDNGKRLAVELEVNDDATLSILKWDVYTERDTDNGDVLWTGM